MRHRALPSILSIVISFLLMQGALESRGLVKTKEGADETKTADQSKNAKKTKKAKKSKEPKTAKHAKKPDKRDISTDANQPPDGAATKGGAEGATETDSTTSTGPAVVAPSALVDLTTARFGRLEINLQDASFLEAAVGNLRLSAENMDMNKGTLDTLNIQVDQGKFQDFTIDTLRMYTHGPLQFDTALLLNQKVLQFKEPANARVRVSVSQASLNKFLNSAAILERISGSAKKRVPILSTLARKDVNFGFSFTGGDVKLQQDNHVRISMESKIGMGKVGMPVNLSADTQLQLANGWVNLADTRLLTAGQSVPHDMATKIITRINSLSVWGNRSDDIKFQFTDLKVVPEEHLELEGTAAIIRLRFQRNQEPAAKTESHGSSDVEGSSAPNYDKIQLKPATEQPGTH